MEDTGAGAQSPFFSAAGGHPGMGDRRQNEKPALEPTGKINREEFNQWFYMPYSDSHSESDD